MPKPKWVMTLELFHFHKQDQAAGEIITEFDAVLHKVATHCKFGDALEETLRGRFVRGLRQENIQRQKPTSRTPMELAQGIEAADKNSKAFKALEPAIQQVNQ